MKVSDFETKQTGDGTYCEGCAFFKEQDCVRPVNFPTDCDGMKYIWLKKEVKKQVGGNHYQSSIQPVDYIHANKLNFFEGNVVKYVTRHKSKKGAEDIRKAIHYLEMVLKFEYGQDVENVD